MIGARERDRAAVLSTSGLVVAFEADPEIAARLQEHGRRNSPLLGEPRTESGLARIGYGDLRIDPRLSPDRGVGHVVNSTNERAFSLDALALDDCSPKYRPPDLMKCEVGGAEGKVLQGARRLLARQRPRMRCEIRNENSRRLVLSEFSRFDSVCENYNDNHVEDHILALPK